MEIKINLDKDEIDVILRENGYVSEEVDITLDTNRFTYQHGSEKIYEPNLKTYKEKVVYRIGERPKYLNNNPLFGINHAENSYDGVVKKIIMDKISKNIKVS